MRHLLAWTLAAAATLAAAPTAAPAAPTAAPAAPTAAPAAPTAAPAASDCPRLSTRWYGDNRARLQHVIDAYGSCSGRKGAVAVFDWDNTVTKNDVTDATLSWALRHDALLRPARWKDTSAWLTDAADRALTAACGTGPGVPLRTSAEPRCADEILEIRENATTMSGAPAFTGRWNHRRTIPQYAWVPQLFAGRTPADLAAYTGAARREALAAPVGATRTLGSHTVPAYVRYYAQQTDLIRTLRRAGFRVYVVSAGVEAVTEVWSRAVGVDAAHTVAIRPVLDGRGRITVRTEGCGGVPGGRGTVIPYIDGKRCWINQEVYGVRGARAWQRRPAAQRPALAAGDADTDVTFVGDATGAHLVINRNKPELMCRAYADADGRWLVNPMFLAPLPRRPASYPCSTTAYTAPDGTHGPVRRADGSPLPDQPDTAY
ncbi:haloacid dehalogenase-like hydrolase [Streptomyces actinomycinicus]|uniref:phosphoserine phosphatase n=1 Tax=Streptomyces actinomycinicus TaxID=1695166 RepID=A0A937EN39_9ACTN|nr:haloacid dehalogenase-like hydrolase [Streptomyces actinomycinicus]MBL1085275.1 haloacid dehalogenase-like hydrolase [Streptomyces actinomycinicus]